MLAWNAKFIVYDQFHRMSASFFTERPFPCWVQVLQIHSRHELRLISFSSVGRTGIDSKELALICCVFHKAYATLYCFKEWVENRKETWIRKNLVKEKQKKNENTMELLFGFGGFGVWLCLGFFCLGKFKVEGEKDGIRSAEILSLLETEVKK